MTFDDDFIRLGENGPSIRCGVAGLEWPPPEVVVIWPGGQEWRRVSCSVITDAQREGMTCVCRGALYEKVEVAA